MRNSSRRRGAETRCGCLPLARRFRSGLCIYAVHAGARLEWPTFFSQPFTVAARFTAVAAHALRMLTQQWT